MIHSVQNAALSRWLRVALGAMVALLVFAASTVRAQAPGTLDTATFGGGTGINTVLMSFGNDGWRGVAVQPDGKIVAAGFCRSPSLKQFCLARFATNGSLDTTFGTGGKQITDIGTADAAAVGLSLQADGKIVLAGSCGASNAAVFCAARYLNTGALDTSFGVSGIAIAPAVGGITNAVASAMAQQGDGKIVVSGTCGTTTTRYCAGRFTAAGALDTTFGSVGVVATVVGSASSNANAMALQPDGAVVVGGQCTHPTIGSFPFCVVRYTSGGSLDASFGSGGIYFAFPNFGDTSGEFLLALALQPDGKIVMGGQCNMSVTGPDFCLARLTTAGVLDTTFGNAGKAILALSPANGVDHMRSLQVMPDGRIVSAGGCADTNGTYNMCISRHNPDGSIDTTFGTGGKTITAHSSVEDIALASAMQTDGKLLFAGHCVSDTVLNAHYCVARYHGGPFGYRNCTLDVDGDGRVLATTDALIHARIALGMTGTAVTNGITFGPNATRTTWSALRTHLITQCGMNLP